MHIGLVVSDPNDWTAQSINRGLEGLGVHVNMFDLSNLKASIGPEISFSNRSFSEGVVNLKDMDALVVRDLGRGAPLDVSFRFEMLKTLEEEGIFIVNTPDSILRAANKFSTTLSLRKAGIPIPKTTVTNSLQEAKEALDLYGTAVCKPLFGYKGKDLVKLSHGDETKLQDILSKTGLLYIQEFVGTSIIRDIRVFVVKNDVMGAIYRNAPPGSWICNLARGGWEEPCPITSELENIARTANKAVKTMYSGVDLLESKDGLKVIEVNGTPSGRGIYSALGVDVGQTIAKVVYTEAA